MTPDTYTVHVKKFSTIREIEKQWTPAEFGALLDEMEFGDRADLSDADLRDMCIMSLQDIEPEEAAYMVLKHVVGNGLREGQLRNAANEMRDEKLWEEYVDPAFHSRMFKAASLLFAAFPRIFPKPDAAHVTIEVQAQSEKGRAVLRSDPDPSFIVRLLAGGMDDHAVLNRFFGDQIAGKSFPAAGDIIWQMTSESAGEDGCVLKIVSSGYWLDPLEDMESYDVRAHADH